ncbi:LOW QUALITY PROTEIN: hypothetical protein TorRG33x02_021040 [Trema orientale]|uniref:Uncharacterized protein n=1 Tax=Trema orientale TaxID=63057 RepID=A0A2P5FX09_TREOI|nr:LOW QUALITY PROTEIN: hypothetical protein TorRG33x02_021040 [Trema orientale]
MIRITHNLKRKKNLENHVKTLSSQRDCTIGIITNDQVNN